MKAIVQDTYGPADVLMLADIDVPVIGDHDVLLRVRAAGVHIGDWHIMTGLPYLTRLFGYGLRTPRTRVRGMDVAGHVEAVGPRVTRFQPGDEVFGTCEGAFAEYARAREDRVERKPRNLTFEQAAVLTVSGVAALQGLRDKGGLRPGQRVLVVGAGGGVGTFAVQLAKALQAHVTGVCSTAKADLVAAIGADEIIDYTRDDFTQTGQHFDLIIDTAGNRTLSQLRRALARTGTLVIVGGEGGGRWIGGTDRQLRTLLLNPFVRQTLRALMSAQRPEDLELLRELAEAGKLTPVIDRTYPLADVAEAFRHLQDGHTRGKVAITLHQRLG